MVRSWVLWTLGLCLFTQSLAAKEKAGEWILTIDTPRNWARVANSLRGRAKLISFFGKGESYALFRGPKKLSHWGTMHPSIVSVQPNFIYSSFSASDPALSQSWALKTIQADQAWKFSTGSKKIKVAILDSGIDRFHEELQNNIFINPLEIPQNGLDDDGNQWVDDTWGWNFIDQNNEPLDDNGHGSFCAGIIGGDWENGKGSRGINQSVSLIAVKILDFLGQGSTASAIEGIEYAVSQGAHIINMSWGGNRFDPALFETIQRAGKQGVLFVAAAGNSSKNNDEMGQAIYPASFNLPEIISVAAYDSKGERAGFSNFGGKTVHLGAPGVDIFGIQLGGFGMKSGTSYAAPHVSGVAALVKSLDPTIGPLELKARILKTVNPLHHYERNYLQTGGLLNAENAIINFVPNDVPKPQRWRKVPWNWSTPHPYASDRVYQLKIREPGASFIRIHFKNFEVEAPFDEVTLKDKSGKKIFTYSGKEESFPTAYALGDEINIEFKTDYNRQLYGFDIDYIEVAND